MTNKDKYLKDGVDVEELCTAIINEIAGEYMGDEEIGVAGLIDFFDSEYKYKPTLTEDEKVILRNVQMQFALISRDEHTDAGKNDLYITDNYGERWSDFSCFNHLFQFIQPRRRI